ncbi:MAG: HTH domain-containing protein [Clostridia bacterium]|nr:HTH domain-containing protein [Clostridia bacterium]
MKSTTERRQTLLDILCQRRQETVGNLAYELCVSRNTIINDILILSMTYPIYTQQGRGGGVFIVDGFKLGMKYLTDKQLALLNKVALLLTEEDDTITIQSIIVTFKNPISSTSENTSNAKRILSKIKSGEHQNDVNEKYEVNNVGGQVRKWK